MIDMALIVIPLMLLVYCMVIHRKLSALRRQLEAIGPALSDAARAIDRAEEVMARARAISGGPVPVSAEVIELQRRTGTGGPDLTERFFGGR